MADVLQHMLLDVLTAYNMATGGVHKLDVGGPRHMPIAPIVGDDIMFWRTMEIKGKEFYVQS